MYHLVQEVLAAPSGLAVRQVQVIRQSLGFLAGRVVLGGLVVQEPRQSLGFLADLVVQSVLAGQCHQYPLSDLEDQLTRFRPGVR